MSSETGNKSSTARGEPAEAGAREPTGEERAAAATVLQMIWGVHISAAVFAAAKLGIADMLATGPMTASELARVTETHEPSLYRVLRLLASLGVLTERENRAFGLTLVGERLRSGVPASMKSWAELTDSVGGVRPFDHIVETVKTGKTAMDLAHGMGVFQFFVLHPELLPRFQAAMSERTSAFASSVAHGYDFSRMRRLADIGGGKGTLLAAILQVHGHLRGVLLDLPNVVAGASDVFQAAGVAMRAEILGADFFKGVPEGADGYILANVLHDWEDERSVEILSNCRRAMATDGRVLIVERLIPDNPSEAVPVLLSDMNMLVFSGGEERTNGEYGQLLSQAGLKLGKVLPVAPPYGVIEGTPNDER